MITSVPANDDVISTDSPRPSALGRPGPPTISATPPSAIVIASHVRRDTRLAEQHPEHRGEQRRERLHEEDVRNRCVVQRDQERAGRDGHQRRDRETAAADRAERTHDGTAFRDRDVREQPDDCEERAAGELRRHADGELALEDARSRPGDRRERDVGAAAAVLRRERKGRGRGRHRAH